MLLSDVAPEMTAIAAERAARRGLRNVVIRELDMEHLDLPDASYDKVLCREASTRAQWARTIVERLPTQ